MPRIQTTCRHCGATIWQAGFGQWQEINTLSMTCPKGPLTKHGPPNTMRKSNKGRAAK